MKARAQLEQGRDLPVGLNAATGGLQRSDEKLEQRRFARAVVADNADAFTVGHRKRDIAQHMIELMPGPAQKNLGKPILRTGVDLEIFVDVLDDNSRWRMDQFIVLEIYRTSPKACLIRMNSQPPNK